MYKIQVCNKRFRFGELLTFYNCCSGNFLTEIGTVSYMTQHKYGNMCNNMFISNFQEKYVYPVYLLKLELM